MTEFEWLRQMRELRQPLTPQRDLWVAIDAALDSIDRSDSPTDPALPAPRTAPRRHWLFAAGLAASVMLVGGIIWQVQQPPPASMPVASSSTAPSPWKPADPRLSGAAVELDAARMELQLAIRQAPDSPALQRLLDRTELQQTQLRQMTHQTG